MVSQRYKMIVAYDGTDHEGWQVQPHGRSVANILQSTFAQTFKSDISLIGASRTDAGVHAFGQVAAFSTNISLDPEILCAIWNRKLPPSITICSMQDVGDSFNPRAYVAQKTYWYHIFTHRPLPFVSRYGYILKGTISINCLRKTLQMFVGTHDFRSFCTGWEVDNTIRTIDSIDVMYNHEWQAYRIIIKGKSFLRYMIRRIVGASLQVAMKQRSLETVQQALADKNPEQALFNAPAQGLLLYQIDYERKL
jgi:tRNA pseudouridine38-40 synthase